MKTVGSQVVRRKQRHTAWKSPFCLYFSPLTSFFFFCLFASFFFFYLSFTPIHSHHITVLNFLLLLLLFNQWTHTQTHKRKEQRTKVCRVQSASGRSVFFFFCCCCCCCWCCFVVVVVFFFLCPQKKEWRLLSSPPTFTALITSPKFFFCINCVSFFLFVCLPPKQLSARLLYSLFFFFWIPLVSACFFSLQSFFFFARYNTFFFFSPNPLFIFSVCFVFPSLFFFWPQSSLPV